MDNLRKYSQHGGYPKSDLSACKSVCLAQGYSQISSTYVVSQVLAFDLQWPLNRNHPVYQLFTMLFLPLPTLRIIN